MSEKPYTPDQITDHFSTLALLFSDANGDGHISSETEAVENGEDPEIIQRMYYYLPSSRDKLFGLPMQGNWTNTTQYQDRYTYNHKEQVTGIEWFAYGARYYDAKIGRFAGVDPIAEKFAWVTGFNYAENMVPGAIDLWGLQGWVVRYDHLATGEITQSWRFDENREARNGVYEEHFYYDENGSQTSARTSTASYSDYPEEFPNQGNYYRNDGKSLITFEGYIQALYGEVAGDIQTPWGPVGVEFGAEGNLSKVAYVSGQGFEFSSIATGDNEAKVGGGVSLFAGIEHRSVFDTGTGVFTGDHETNASLIFSNLGVSGGGEHDNPSIIFGIPEIKFSLGFGLNFGLYLSLNPQPSLTHYEKVEKEALNDR